MIRGDGKSVTDEEIIASVEAGNQIIFPASQFAWVMIKWEEKRLPFAFFSHYYSDNRGEFIIITRWGEELKLGPDGKLML